MQSDEQERRAPRAWLFVLLALVAVAAVYAEALGGGFVWDDRWLIEEATLVKQIHPLTSYLKNPLWVAGEWGPDDRWLYRPLVTFSYAIDNRLHGGNPAGFHLTNVLAHLLNVGLVLLLARRQGASAAMAALVATAWGVAPRLAESVAWISGRTDVLAATFSLLALAVFPWKRHGHWLAAVAFLLALLCKEVAISVLAALLVRALLAKPGRRRHELLRVAPTAGAALVYFVLRASMIDAPTLTRSHGASARALTVLEAIGRYAAMTVDAWRSRTQIGLAFHPDYGFVALGALVTVGLVVAAIVHRQRLRRQRDLVAMLALALTAIALVLHVIPLPVNVVAADRFLYLPLAALTIAVAPALGAWLGRSRPIVPFAVMGVMSLGVMARERARDWGDEVRLWSDAVRNSHPKNALPWLQLGNLHLRYALYQPALACYEHGLLSDPTQKRVDGLVAEVMVANTASALGQHERGVSMLEAVVKFRADVPRFWLDLALARQHALDFGGARVAAQNALTLMPSYPQASDFLSALDELEREYKTLPPRGSYEAGRQRARFLGRVGRPREATAEWLALLSRPNADRDDHAAALEFCGRYAPIEDVQTLLLLRVASAPTDDPPDPKVMEAFEFRRSQANALAEATRGLQLPKDESAAR